MNPNENRKNQFTLVKDAWATFVSDSMIFLKSIPPGVVDTMHSLESAREIGCVMLSRVWCVRSLFRNDDGAPSNTENARWRGFFSLSWRMVQPADGSSLKDVNFPWIML